MAFDPTLSNNPTLRKQNEAEIQAQREHERAVLAEQRQQEIKANQEAKAAERQQARDAKAAQVQQNLATEAESIATGRPTWTGSDGVMRFKQSETDWQAAQTRQQQEDAKKLRFQQEGRKFTEAADGSIVPLESDAVLEKRRQDEGEALRKSTLDRQIKAIEAERDYITSSKGLRPLSATAREKLADELKNTRYSAINSLMPRLQEKAKATDKAGFWDVVNNNATPEAQAAQARLARLQQPDADLDDADLAELEADPTTAPTATKLRTVRDLLSKADEADKFHGDMENRLNELKMRRDAPDRWEALQRQKVASLATPEEITAHLESADADLQKRLADFQTEADALQTEAAQWQSKADELAQKNEQARKTGIPAGELVTLSDGSTWHAPLAEQLMSLQAEQQAQAGDFTQRRRALEVQQSELQKEIGLRNEAAAKLQQTATAKQKTSRDVLRFTPGFEGSAGILDQLDREAAARAAEVAQQFPEDSPQRQAALDAIQQDIEAKSQQAQAAGQQTAAAAAAAYLGIQTRLRENPRLQAAAGDLFINARRNLAQSLGISEEQAGNLLEDQESLDWSTIQGKHGEAAPDGNAAQRFMTEAAGDKRQFRVLKNGGLIINPQITDPEAYRKAVEAAPAMPEAKAAALARQPDLRQRYGAQALETLDAIGDEDWQAFQQTNASLPREEAAARYADKLKAETSLGGKILRQVFQSMAQGVDDIGSQALGLLSGITGSETLMQGAQALNERAALIEADKALRGASGNYALDTLGQFARLAPSLIPAAGGARAATASLALLGRTTLGARILPALSQSLRAAKTPAEAAKAAQQMLKSAGLAGAATAGGAQTYGAQVADIYTTLRREHPELDHSTALRQAQLPALLSAGMTALLTVAGGSTGVEKLITAPAATKEAFKKAYTTRLQQAGAIGKAVATGGVKELPEEIADELFSTVASAVATGQSVPLALAQFADSLPEMAGAIFALGGLGEGVQAFRESQTAAPDATPPAESAAAQPVTPEMLAAAESEIDAFQMEGLDEARLAQTQATARALLYIAQGDIADLPDADLALVGIRRTASGELENLATSADGQPPRVKMEKGQPLITQPTLDKLAQVLPAVRAAIPLSEAERRAQISPAVAAAGTAPDSATGVAGTTDSPDQNADPRGSSGQGPAAATDQDAAGNPQAGAPAVSGAPAASFPEGSREADRSAQLASYLETLGLPPEQAAPVANHLVRRQGIEGADYLENVVRADFPKILKELGITGSLRAQEAGTNPLRAPADIEARIATAERQGEKPAAPKAPASTNATKAPDAPKDASSKAKPAATEEAAPPTTWDTDAFLMARQKAMSKVPVAERRRFQKFVNAFDEAMTQFAPAFPAIRFADGPQQGLNYTGAGIAILNENGKPTGVQIDLFELYKNTAHLDDRAFSKFVRMAIKHELRHVAALRVISLEDAQNLWQKLTPKLRNRVYASYYAVDIHNAAAKGKLTQRQLLEITNDHLTGTRKTPGLPEANPFHMAHEFLRMLDEDAEFAGQTSEAVDADPSLGEAILDFLRKVMDEIKRLIDTELDQETRVQVNEMRKLVEASRKKLIASLPKRDPIRKGEPPPSIAQAADNRRPVLGGTGSTPEAEAPAAFQPVLGKTGTAYTDSNDAIEYQWAVVDVNSLNISNADDGRINPAYPQELQPRDRTSISSEQQVADIAKNMNLDRLSAANGVGDGAPIVGADAVVESGNGRSMGQRRAYMQNGEPARSYRAALIARASEFGLNAEQVEAVKNPVLVRIRRTEVDRTAFVLAANVSTISPKREIEQAKIDAKLIVPDLFTTFVPSEDGDIFTAANADFIRGFVSLIVPPAERPALIDARGNLTQTGLRRVRNALFVHAYGPSPETLNALSRLTESIDTSGSNITNALVAAAPRFAEQQARIDAGALYPLSLTEDLAWTVQKLQDLRNRNEKVPDYLAQDGIPGIDDVPTALQKELLQFFEANKSAPRQLSAALARYANAIDNAGDPKQQSLFGDEPRPTREELWKLASTPRAEAALAMSSRTAEAAPRRQEWTNPRDAVLDALNSAEDQYILRAAQAAPDLDAAARIVANQLRQAGAMYPHSETAPGRSWEGSEKGLRVRIGDNETVVPWKAVAKTARDNGADLFTADTRTSLPAPTALKLYRKLKEIEAKQGQLNGTQAQTLEKAERSLGQLFLFDNASLQTTPPDFQLEQETITPTRKPQAQQLSLFMGRKSVPLPGYPRTIIDRAISINNGVWSKIDSLLGTELSRAFSQPDTDVVFLVKPIGLEMDGERILEDFIRRHGGIIADRWKGRVTQERMAQHYAEHAAKPFFPKLTGYYQGREVAAYRVKVRADAIPALRAAVGKSSVPKGEDSLRASIMYAGQGAEAGWNNLATDPNFQGIDNGIHLSDSPEAGQKESVIWFSQAAKDAPEPPPATPDIADVVPGLPREIRQLTEQARRAASIEAETFLPTMRQAARKAGLRFLPALAGDAVRPMPKGTLETVPTDLLRTTLQDGRTEEELVTSTERLIPALSALGYRIAATTEGEPMLNTDEPDEIVLGLVRDNGTQIDGLVRELRIASPDLIRRRTTLYGNLYYRWKQAADFLKARASGRKWFKKFAEWEDYRPAAATASASFSVNPSASISRPSGTAANIQSTAQSNPASNSSLKVRLLNLTRAGMSAARLSSSDRARYALKASVMPEDTRFRPDEQGESRQPTTQEQALFTLDNLMMQSGGARELDGPHALNGMRTLRLAGPARRRFLAQVWDMQEATYAAIGNPYKSASDLLAEDAVFDVAMDAEGRPAAFAILKPSRYGWKGISFGSNGSAEGKQAVHAALARMKTPGYYAELSDAAERSAKRQGVPAVRASMAVTMVKRAKALDDGLSYERGITGLPEPHVKTLYGLPWNAAWETLVATQPAPLAMGRRNAAAGIQNPADQKLVLDSIARHEAGLRELDALLADIVPLRQQFNVLNARWKTIPESDEAARSELRPQIYQLLDQIEAKEKASRSLRRSLNALPDVFVRFGRPPENGRSQNFLRSSAIRQAFEAGVSAFPTLWQDGRWKIVTSLGSEPTLDAFIGEANRHIYLVTGDVVDEGEDNEPVLGNFRVLKELDAAEILPAFYAAEDWDATLEDQPWTPLYMGRKNVSSDGGSDLFSFDFSSSNEGLGLSSLLTPVQQERKVKAQLDLFGGTTNAIPRPRPASPRPAQSARSQKPARAPEAAPDFGELFGQTGLGSNSGGGSGGRSLAGQSGTGQPGGGGGGRADANGGGETGGAGTDSAGEAGLETGADSDMPGVRGDGDASDSDTLVRRPDVGSPERNFEIPADLATIAPATDRAKIQANIEAIRLLKQLEAEGRNPTTEEKHILASYTGWGAFKEAFNTQYEQDIAETWDKPGARRQYMPDHLQSWERNHRANYRLLREAMTEEEFTSASASTLNAHYTALPIIRSMWKMVQRLGFTGGRALEPSAGAGHYIGTTPAEIADSTRWQAVELDDLTARLLSKLYPEAVVNELQPDPARAAGGLGFERARIPNGSLDLIISNVPFHESGPSKKGFPKLNLHNFFFAHALDKVKPGGLVAFITSESTMQNNIRQRDFLASKGDLVAAFRLPNNAFKANAGTEVTTDILIFRKPDGTPFKGESWQNLVEVGTQTITVTQRTDQTLEDFRAEAERLGTPLGKDYWKGERRAMDVSAPILVNEYFVRHPDHALGQHTLTSTMYRAGGYALTAPAGFDVQAALDAVIAKLPENIMGQQAADTDTDVKLAGRDDKPFSFKEEDGKIYEVQPDGSMVEAEWSTNPDLVKSWRSWRTVADAAQKLVEAETSNLYTDDELDRLRQRLNVVYDTHVDRYKAVSRRRSNNHKHLYSDPAYPLTAALETEVVTLSPKGAKTYTYKKADIFKKRIGRPIIEPTSATDINDAIEKSLAWRARIDPAFASNLLGMTQEAFEIAALQRPDIFRNPTTGLLESSEDYLTGNVRLKLQQAEDALEDDPRMQKNVDALKAAQPERREIARISAQLGSRWVPAEVYNAFIAEVLQGKDTVEYIPAGNTWSISGPGVYATEEFGTERKSAAKLLKHALDMSEPIVWNGRGDDREFDPAETAAAKVSLDKMRRAFVEFAKTSVLPVTITSDNGDTKTVPVWEAVEDAFNETQNSYVNPRHTGAYLTFPGLNTDYVYTRAHRRAVIARFLATRRGMMAHGVGSGKTFNQIILSYELRRLGLAKKPVIVVQNSTLGQFAKSYLKAYPAAKLLVPTKDDFDAANRQRTVAKIATGDWDAVILPHSQFDLISNRPEAVKAYMDSQIDELRAIVTRTKDKAKVRDMEGMIKRLKDRRQSMLDELAERQDKSIMWEDLGIDALIMDEAHNYKSLPIITRMGRVKGVPASSDSQRAINFMLKCRDVQRKTGGKNIFLATGTPIKNSMAEAYIMMQFMAPDVLESFRIFNFDDFATTYGQTVTEAEMAWGGTPKMETRFSKFQNGPSLVTMIRTMFDVAFGNDKLGLDVPKIKGGEPEMIIVPATKAINEFNAWTRSVDYAWKNAEGETKELFTAVPIQTMAAGIAAALDPRMISAGVSDDPNSKVNTALRRVVEIYKAGKDKRTTQVIFSDLRNPFKMDYILDFMHAVKAELDEAVEHARKSNPDIQHPVPNAHPFPDAPLGEFDLYADMKRKLVEAGIPEKEIHLMQSGMKDTAKTALFEKVDNGEIRIIIGSTELLGVGVNIQSRLKAVHHLMPPRDFTPAMMEQRNGRIIRQGNLHAEKVEGAPAWNEEVEILNYGTDGSMDSAIYGTLARKQKFIIQLLSGDDVGDTFDDPTDPVAINMAEMAARTLGDPDFIRRIELEREIREMRLLSEAYMGEISGKRSRLARMEMEIRGIPDHIKYLQNLQQQFEGMWTRKAPRPEGIKEDTDIADKPVYQFGGQTVDTAAKDGAITNKLDLFLLDASKTAERRGATTQTVTITINGVEVNLSVHITTPGNPTGGDLVDQNMKKIVSFNGAAGLIQQLRKLPGEITRSIERNITTRAEQEQQAAKLRAQLETMPPRYPDADRLADLEREAQEVEARIRAKVAPPVVLAKPAKDDTADLPEMKPVSPGLMTYDVEQVIDGADIIGNKLFLPDQLDRKLYKAVNAALEDAGGRWNKKAKAHIFKGDPRPYLGLAPMPEPETTALPMSTRRAVPPLVKEEVQAYFNFDDVRIPEAKQPAARRAIAAAAAATEAAYPLPLPTAGGIPGGLRERIERRRAEALRGWRGLINRSAEEIRAAFEANNGRISSLMHEFIRREIPSWNIQGAIIESPADFAAFNLAVRTPYFESVKIAVVGDGFQVIHSQILHVGSINESILSPAMVAGVIEAAKVAHPKQRIEGFILGHNHPSGETDPSGADRAITTRLRDIGDLLGVPLLDHIITNGSSYFSFREVGLSSNLVAERQRPRKPKLPVLPRPEAPPRFPHQSDTGGVLADWEVVPSGDTGSRPEFTQRWTAKSFVEALATGDPDHHHLLYLDTRLKLRAVERVPKTANLAATAILGAAREGAAGVMLGFAPRPSSEGTISDQEKRILRTLREALQTASVTLLDAISFSPDNRSSTSAAEMGLVGEPLAMSTRAVYSGTYEQGSGLGQNQLDRRTAGITRISGSRVTAEQGRAVRDVHFARLITGPLREGGAFARSDFDWSPGPRLAQELSTAFGAPILTAQQEQDIRALPVNDDGVESVVYLDRANGVIYKRLQNHSGNPSGGIWPYVGTTSLKRLDWSFQPALNPRRVGLRLALLTGIGGTPTEVAAIGQDGHIYLKQPLSPNPGIGRNEEFLDNSGLAIARRRAGIVEIPGRMLPQNAPRAFITVVRNIPWLVSDLHPDNIIGDNQGNGRINDPVFGQLKPDIIAKVPGLAAVVEQAKIEATRLDDRANRLFKATSTVNTPASPLARLGWNHLDRHLSAKLAAAARWMDDKTGAGETVARWQGSPSAMPFIRAAKLLKGQFFPDSMLAREVAAKKREMEINTAVASQQAMDLVRALSGTPKFSDIVYPPEFAQNPVWRSRLYMAMTGEQPMTSLPPELQALAGRLRAILVEIGQEAVKQGRMSLDTFELLREGYMPHYYREDVQREKSLFHRFRLGIRDILAQRTTAWHIEDTAQKEPSGEYRLVNWQPGKWRFRNKEHRDAFYEDFILGKALDELRAFGNKSLRNLTLSDLRAPAKLPAETRGRLDEIKRNLRRRYTPRAPLTLEQKVKAGLIMDPVYAIARYAAQAAHDNNTAEFFNFVAAKPEYISDVSTPGFTEVPDNPRFGRLAGKFVQEDIARQVLEMVEAPNIALEIYDTILGWWKTGKTVLNPGTHVRNILGNVFFSQLAGTSLWNPGNTVYYREAIQALRQGGPVLQEAYQQGVLGADFVSVELRQTLRQLLPDPVTIQDGDRTILLGISKALGKYVPEVLKNPLHKSYNAIAALYQAEDEVFKLASYLKAKAMLNSPDEAAKHVRKWFPYFDSGSSPTLKAIGRTAMPFLGFYRESIRIFGIALKERPLALAGGLAVPSLITFLSALALGLDDDELEQVQKDMRGKAGKLLGPTPLEGRPLFSMLLPVTSDQGQLQQFDISAVHPFVDFLGNRVESSNSEDWYQKTLRSLIAAGPIGSLLYSQMTGRDAFGDRTFVEDNMDAGEKLVARLDNAAKTLLPPLAPGGTGFETLANAGERTTNKTMEVRSPSQAVLRAIGGLDVRNATPDLYRIADDWRKANGIPTTEGMDFSGSTPVSRARKALFAQLAQPEPNLAAIANIKQRLAEMGSPIQNEQDINRLLFYRNPLMIIRGEENQQRFRASLSGLERETLENALREFEQIKARAPALLR